MTQQARDVGDFVRDVLVDFAKVAAEVLQRRTTLLAGVNN
jgi:hypothetical protein